MLLHYATTKGAIQNFTGGLAQLWAEKGIRSELCCAWSSVDAIDPVYFSTGRSGKVRTADSLKRAGQPAELAPAYVLLASDDSSYILGATIQVTGGTPTI